MKNIIYILLFTFTCFSMSIAENPYMKKFVIGAYCSPPEAELTQGRIDEIAAAKINMIIARSYTNEPSDSLKLLNLSAKAGIKAVILDTRWGEALKTTNDQIIARTVKEITTDYSKKPALFAYGVYDEPDTSLFPALAKYSRMYISADAHHPPLINILPSYGSPTQLGAPDFRSYVREYINIVKPIVLSYDYYPFRVGATMFDGWHSDLRIVREESREAKIPFWIFIQSEGIKGGLKVPTRGEVFWQANTALAYGARGILWFCYWTPPYKPEIKFPEKHYSAMIDINGKKTPVYNFVKEENEFLEKAGNALICKDNKFVARYKNGKLIYGETPFFKPKGKNLNLVIGTFVDGKSVRVVFSNDSFDKKTFFSLPKEKFKIVESFHTKNKKNNFEMQPGGCVIMEISN